MTSARMERQVEIPGRRALSGGPPPSRAAVPARVHRVRSSSLAGVLVAWLVLLGAATSCAQPVATPVTGRVIRVIDGDTFDARLADGRRVRIRVFGIDAPERGEPFSDVARRRARALLFDKDVTLTPVDTDRYGRTVARVTVDGADFAEAMVGEGLARHYRRYSNDARLDALEAEARAARRGLWQQQRGASPRAAPAPRSGPRQLVPAGSGLLHGNVRSRVYHVSTCRNANCPNCTVRFETAEEAQAAGYRPAGDCHRR